MFWLKQNSILIDSSAHSCGIMQTATNIITRELLHKRVHILCGYLIIIEKEVFYQEQLKEK